MKRFGCLAVIFLLTFVTFSVSPISSASSLNTLDHITVLARNQEPYQIQLYNGYVYWLNNESQIRRVPETGGKVETVFKSSEIWSFLVAGDLIYWGTQNSLNRYNLTSDKNYVLCTQNESLYCSDASSIQASANYVFFASPPIIVRIDTNGSGLEVIGPSFSVPSGLVLSSTFLYWNNAVYGQAGKMLLSGKDARYVSPDLCKNCAAGRFADNVHTIIVVNSSVYWTYNVIYSNDSYFAFLNSVTTSGKNFSTLFKRNTGVGNLVTSVSYYNGSIIFSYEIGPNDGKVLSVPSTGGTARVIATIFVSDSVQSGGYLYASSTTQIDRITL